MDCGAFYEVVFCKPWSSVTVGAFLHSLDGQYLPRRDMRAPGPTLGSRHGYSLCGLNCRTCPKNRLRSGIPMTVGLYPNRNQNVIGDSTTTFHVIRMPQCITIANCPYHFIAISYAPGRLWEHDDRPSIAGKHPSVNDLSAEAVSRAIRNAGAMLFSASCLQVARAATWVCDGLDAQNDSIDGCRAQARA